jgi:hypothetical protein
MLLSSSRERHASRAKENCSPPRRGFLRGRDESPYFCSRGIARAMRWHINPSDGFGSAERDIDLSLQQSHVRLQASPVNARC